MADMWRDAERFADYQGEGRLDDPPQPEREGDIRPITRVKALHVLADVFWKARVSERQAAQVLHALGVTADEWKHLKPLK